MGLHKGTIAGLRRNPHHRDQNQLSHSPTQLILARVRFTSTRFDKPSYIYVCIYKYKHTYIYWVL